MTENHQPDPEFVSNLEWQVRTALRREHRFAEPVESRSGGRMKIATLVLVSALFGAGGVVVKDEVQEARRTEILLAEVEGEQRLAEMEMEIVRIQLADVQERHENGLVSEEALLNALAQLRRVELHLDRLGLNEQEIRATGREPRDDLAAPLVRGEDLVTERLQLDVSAALEELGLAQAQLARMQELQESGMAAEEDVLHALTGVEQIQAHVDAIQRKIELREEVLEGRMSATAAEAELELAEVEGELRVLEEEREWASSRLQHTMDRVNMGTSSDWELRGVQLQLLRIETRMEVLQMKREILEREMGGPGGYD